MKKWIAPALAVALVAVTAMVFAKAKNSSEKSIVCNQEYALCSSGLCTPDPEDSSKAICYCKVHKGVNLGNLSCDARTPKIDGDGVKSVIPTFSILEYPERKVLSCAEGNPWSNCLDAPCTVYPRNPTQAVCICPINRTEPFDTLGGDCDQDTCATGFWSGATRKGVTANIAVIEKALKGKTAEITYCPKETSD